MVSDSESADSTAEKVIRIAIDMDEVLADALGRGDQPTAGVTLGYLRR